MFRASHPTIGKLAAIKILSRKYSGDPSVVSRFTAEARAVNQIRHRNIIDIFAFGKLDDGRSYYVMELLDGEPLDALLSETGGVAIGEALPILRGIARRAGCHGSERQRRPVPSALHRYLHWLCDVWRSARSRPRPLRVVSPLYGHANRDR